MEYDIVITGFVGAYGAAILCENKTEELSQYFNKGFLRQTCDYKIAANDDERKAKKLALDNGLPFSVAGECGIYKALWDLGEELNKGFELNMRKFPMMQHTIEICEFFDISPYELFSTGAVCIAAQSGLAVAKKATELGLNTALVGHTTDNNDRLLYYDEEARFLRVNKKDALYKVIRKSRIIQ